MGNPGARWAIGDKTGDRIQAPYNLPSDVIGRVDQIRGLKSMPQVTLNLLAMLADKETRMNLIEAEIAKDPGFSAQVLRVVNSSFYGLTEKIDSIHRAVSMLGYGAVKNIVLVHQVASKLARVKGSGQGALEAFWDHSLWVGNMAYVLSEQTDCPWPDEYFTCGLLHDIGKLAVFQLNGDGPAWKREPLEACHDEIGAYLAWKWYLPEAVLQASRYHHRAVEEVAALPLRREALLSVTACHLAHELTDAEKASWCALAGTSVDRFDMLAGRVAHQVECARKEVFAVA